MTGSKSACKLTVVNVEQGEGEHTCVHACM
jgi:hypothetical protein